MGTAVVCSAFNNDNGRCWPWRLRASCLGHYLSAYDEGSFADVVLNFDIHQQNAERVGCTRKEVKTITYAFIYGAGDAKLGLHSTPHCQMHRRKQLGQELRRKFLDAMIGALLMQSNLKFVSMVVLGALMGVPNFPWSQVQLRPQKQAFSLSVGWRHKILTADLTLQRWLTSYVHDEQQMLYPKSLTVSNLRTAARREAGLGYSIPLYPPQLLTDHTDTGQVLTNWVRCN